TQAATIVNGGTLSVTTDAALGVGGAPVTANAFGTLTLAATTSFSRFITLNSGTLTVASGQTATLNNCSVGGGFVAGPGSLATATGSSSAFSGNTTSPSATLTLNGSDTLTNFANGGQLTVAANHTGTLKRFNNGSSGRMTIK